MFYTIQHLSPHPQMGGYGFNIELHAGFRQMVADYTPAIEQSHVDHVIRTRGRNWLDICGYDQIYDPDDSRSPFEREEGPPEKPGPNARPLYEPRESLRISWGEWGPEHISVPGDACGLDLDRHSGFGAPPDGQILVPHNVDHWGQVQLLLILFCFFAETLTNQYVLREMDKRHGQETLPNPPAG